MKYGLCSVMGRLVQVLWCVILLSMTITPMRRRAMLRQRGAFHAFLRARPALENDIRRDTTRKHDLLTPHEVRIYIHTYSMQCTV